MAPFGSLLAGSMASRIGAPKTVMFGGVLSIAGAAWFAQKLPGIRNLVRPIYRELGIIPEIAAGVQNATALQSPTTD
ncbi:MAG: hypothetical protein H0X25_23715 [Acidobacteriales bacterium]|nr:hypothetical protein [Terriglobales bacterium]